MVKASRNVHKTVVLVERARGLEYELLRHVRRTFAPSAKGYGRDFTSVTLPSKKASLRA